MTSVSGTRRPHRRATSSWRGLERVRFACREVHPEHVQAAEHPGHAHASLRRRVPTFGARHSLGQCEMRGMPVPDRADIAKRHGATLGGQHPGPAVRRQSCIQRQRLRERGEISAEHWYLTSGQLLHHPVDLRLDLASENENGHWSYLSRSGSPGWPSPQGRVARLPVGRTRGDRRRPGLGVSKKRHHRAVAGAHERDLPFFAVLIVHAGIDVHPRPGHHPSQRVRTRLGAARHVAAALPVSRRWAKREPVTRTEQRVTPPWGGRGGLPFGHVASRSRLIMSMPRRCHAPWQVGRAASRSCPDEGGGRSPYIDQVEATPAAVAHADRCAGLGSCVIGRHSSWPRSQEPRFRRVLEHFPAHHTQLELRKQRAGGQNVPAGTADDVLRAPVSALPSAAGVALDVCWE